MSVRELRVKTNAPIVACRDALAYAGGDVEKAVERLRVLGLAKAAELRGRDAAEGVVGCYVHHDKKLAVLVEVACQTDFVARLPEFRRFADDVAMHVAGRDPAPICVDETEIPEAASAKELEVQRARSAELKGRPAAVVARVLEGAMRKWRADVVLRSQPFLRNPTKTIGDLEAELSALVGEAVRIRRFVCVRVGDVVAKKAADFAAEVAKQLAEVAS